MRISRQDSIRDLLRIHSDGLSQKQISKILGIALSKICLVVKAMPDVYGKKEVDEQIDVPQGFQSTTQPDGSTRISKIGSIPSAEYKQNMAAYKAQNWTPEKIADYGQRMASGQGYTSAEKAANYQQQQQYLGKYADDAVIQQQGIDEEKQGLWANIHAKRERIQHGSGERMRKPGSKGAPTAAALKKSAK